MGYKNLWEYFGGHLFCKPEIGIYISLLVIKLVLVVELHDVGCCMACVS